MLAVNPNLSLKNFLETLIEISWEELLNRPKFKTSISGDVELDSVIGMYTAPNKVICGLQSCKTPHNKGFVILTADGVETNIGQVCGKENFQLNFEKILNKIKPHDKEHPQTARYLL